MTVFSLGCIDVAIIGAGVSGSYSAWRLRHHNLDIQMFETTDHVGGKLFSKFLEGNPPILLELGADHYSPSVKNESCCNVNNQLITLIVCLVYFRGMGNEKKSSQ